jgi:3-methylcrotonyl-CoA carboxylase alpha subunit
VQPTTSNPNDPYSPWQSNIGWRTNHNNINYFDLAFEQLQLSISVENKDDSYVITTDAGSVEARAIVTGHELIACIDDHHIKVSLFQSGTTIYIFSADYHGQCELLLPNLGMDNLDLDGGVLTAPMPGTIVELLVSPGQIVAAGDSLLVMEAMKMEHTISAPSSGKVVEFFYQAGDLVDNNAVLLDFSVEE